LGHSHPKLVKTIKNQSRKLWHVSNAFQIPEGEKLAKKAQEKNITKIYFDRGSYKYHGRIKVFAETLRENGMEF